MSSDTNPVWRTFSRPEDDAYEYVVERRDQPGKLFSYPNGTPVVFDLKQVRAINAGMEPADAMKLVEKTTDKVTAPIPPARTGIAEPAEPVRKKPGRKPKNGSTSHHAG